MLEIALPAAMSADFAAAPQNVSCYIIFDYSSLADFLGKLRHNLLTLSGMGPSKKDIDATINWHEQSEVSSNVVVIPDTHADGKTGLPQFSVGDRKTHGVNHLSKVCDIGILL